MLQNNWKEIAFADQKTLTIHGKEESMHAINFGIVKRMIHIACEAYNNFNIVQKEKFAQRRKNLLSNNNANSKNKIVR